MPPSDRRIVRRRVRRFRNQREAYRKGEMTLEEMSLSVQSWIAHLILEAVMEPGQQGERLDLADRLLTKIRLTVRLS
jgi:hypothetical protein